MIAATVVTNRRKAPSPPPRHAYIVLAQFEHGPIAAVITTWPDAWKEEEIRLNANAFSEFKKFEFASLDAAKASITKLSAAVSQQFGAERVNDDATLAKVFNADWPIVLDLFTAQMGLKAAA